jgi:hypothetical protein
MSKSNSELISWFQRVKQNLQLEEEKIKLKTFTKNLQDRRERLKKKFPDHIDEDEDEKKSKPMNKSIGDA